MSSVPQGAFASFKVKQNLKKIKFGNADEEVTNSGHFLSSEANFEHPLLKYSSKLMNSIWGEYNRYSVHNFKKNAAEVGNFNVFNNHHL